VVAIVVDAWGRSFRLTPGGIETGELGARPAPVPGPEKVGRPVATDIAACAEEVARRSGVAVVRMRGPFRHPEVARARMAAMWLAHARYGAHPTDLGVFFRRHRTTVLHALSVVAEVVRSGTADHPDWCCCLVTG
jgi:hypothetical protein